MSRYFNWLEDGKYKEKIESMDICKWKYDDICCNGDCKEYVADYPSCKCKSEEDCDYFEKEDGVI